jgi:hypothetical protein
MKKVILFVLLMCVFAFGQSYYPKVIFPFLTGNDTMSGADTLDSGWLYIGDWHGAVVLGIEPDLVSGNADVLTIQTQFRIGDLSGGMFADSIYSAAKPWMKLDTLGAGSVVNGYVKMWPLSTMSWWSFVSDIRFRIISDADVGSIYIKCRLVGQ